MRRRDAIREVVGYFGYVAWWCFYLIQLALLIAVISWIANAIG